MEIYYWIDEFEIITVIFPLEEKTQILSMLSIKQHLSSVPYSHSHILNTIQIE